MVMSLTEILRSFKFTAYLGEKKVCSGEFCYCLYVQVVSLNPSSVSGFLLQLIPIAALNFLFCFVFSVLLIWQSEPKMG